MNEHERQQFLANGMIAIVLIIMFGCSFFICMKVFKLATSGPKSKLSIPKDLPKNSIAAKCGINNNDSISTGYDKIWDCLQRYEHKQIHVSCGKDLLTVPQDGRDYNITCAEGQVQASDVLTWMTQHKDPAGFAPTDMASWLNTQVQGRRELRIDAKDGPS